jgi:transcriptional regulator with XRE-family HTH domain
LTITQPTAYKFVHRFDGAQRPKHLASHGKAMGIMESGNPVDKHVGGRVRSRRIVLGMSPKDLADAIETTVQQVQQWEAGTSRIGATRLMKLTKILGVNAAFFFADSEPNEPSGAIVLKETLSSQSILGSMTSLDTLRLIRAFASIKNRGFRNMIVKLVETMAKRQNVK